MASSVQDWTDNRRADHGSTVALMYPATSRPNVPTKKTEANAIIMATPNVSMDVGCRNGSKVQRPTSKP
jgi:hypothetical protein